VRFYPPPRSDLSRLEIAVNIRASQLSDMDSEQAWKVIGESLDELVAVMLVVPEGDQIEVFCDPTGTKLSFSEPSSAAHIRLCTVIAPDLKGHYGISPRADGFVNDEGEEIPKGQLAAYLAQYIASAKDGGAEWGWEFKVSEES
jgi:hypothetical protein